MPINIPNALPAREHLERENIFVMTEERAVHQDIRPLKIAIVNLMHTTSHESRSTDPEHLDRFYTSLEHIRSERYVGMVITGAPMETIPFEDVDYWDELAKIMEYSPANVYSTLHICWGAQAGLYHHYGIEKYPMSQKLFGVFEHERLDDHHPIFRGFDDRFPVPHSRYTEVRLEDIQKRPELEVLATSEQAGVCVVSAFEGRQVFITGHLEYEAETLELEYRRDVDKGLKIDVPEHYFPDNDPSRKPMPTWRAHAHLFFSNWLNYHVYQATPYDLSEIPEIPRG